MTHPIMGGSPSYASPSPIRSSPLTAPPHFSPTRSPSPSAPTSRYLPESKSTSIPTSRRFSQPASSLRRPSRSLLIPFTPSSPPLSTSESSSHAASPPLSRSQPLLGSYQLSLLHSRMSRTQSHSVPSTSTQGFSIRIGGVGKGKTCPPELRSPSPLTIPFSATYYDLLDPTEGKRMGAAQTPWVGNLDLEEIYFDRFTSHHTSGGGSPPSYPGFQVAPIGQLQIIVKSAETPLRVFVIPYDLRHLSPGSRLLVRERTFVDDPAGTISGKEYLRYAIQLQFICHPSYPKPSSPGRESSTTRRSRQSSPATPSISDNNDISNRQYYLSKSLKVIFSAQAPSSVERVRTERSDEVVPPSGSQGTVSSPASIGRRGIEEWEMVRQKWMARRKLQEEVPEVKGSAELVSPTATSSPLPILSPASAYLPIIHSAAPSRPTTPTSELFPRVISPPPGNSVSLLQMTKPPVAKKNKRQGSGSVAERELSEKLRLLELKDGKGSLSGDVL